MNEQFLVSTAVASDATAIFELFKTNYKSGYYNKNFASPAAIVALIARADFTGIVVKDGSKLVGFSGIYTQIKQGYNEIYLANFLVDTDYRGLGVGSIIDERKLKYCEQLKPRSIVYSILGESSQASVQIKKKYLYDVWGIRLFYGEWEPNQDGDGHLWVFGRTVGFEQGSKRFPALHSMTRALIQSVQPTCEFLASDTVAIMLLEVQYPDNVEFGQCACLARISEAGTPIATVLDQLIEHDDWPYIALRINVDGHSAELENILLAHNFFPTCYLPYFDDGVDVIEYQYVKPEKLDRISHNLVNRTAILRNKAGEE